MTVDELIKALADGKAAGRWQGHQEVRISVRFPQTAIIEEIEAASESPGMYGSDCVLLLA